MRLELNIKIDEEQMRFLMEFIEKELAKQIKKHERRHHGIGHPKA